MKSKYLILLSFLFAVVLKQICAQNPYASLGIEAEVLTLSDGKYQEVFTNDTIVRIGSVLFDRVQGKIIHSSNEKGNTLKPEIVSRFLSVDPLAKSYPYYTPYQFAGNSPILFIDLDGLEPTYPKSLEEWNEPQLKVTTGQQIRDWWNFGGTSKTSGFNSNDYDRFKNYVNLNIQMNNKRRAADESYKEQSYSGPCAYNCINNANAAFKIVMDNFELPQRGNFRELLTAMNKRGYAGQEFATWVTYQKADGSSGTHKGYPNMGTITGFESSVADKLLSESQSAGAGYHLFGVSIGDGFHSIVASVYVNEDGNHEFGWHDQNKSYEDMTSSEFDVKLIDYMNTNSMDKNKENWIGLGKRATNVVHKTRIHTRKIQKSHD